MKYTMKDKDYKAFQKLAMNIKAEAEAMPTRLKFNFTEGYFSILYNREVPLVQEVQVYEGIVNFKYELNKINFVNFCKVYEAKHRLYLERAGIESVHGIKPKTEKFLQNISPYHYAKRSGHKINIKTLKNLEIKLYRALNDTNQNYLDKIADNIDKKYETLRIYRKKNRENIRNDKMADYSKIHPLEKLIKGLRKEWNIEKYETNLRKDKIEKIKNDIRKQKKNIEKWNKEAKLKWA